MRDPDTDSIDRMLSQVQWPPPPAGLRERIVRKAEQDNLPSPPPFIVGWSAPRAALLGLIIIAAFCTGVLTSREDDTDNPLFYSSSGLMLTQLFTGDEL